MSGDTVSRLLDGLPEETVRCALLASPDVAEPAADAARAAGAEPSSFSRPEPLLESLADGDTVLVLVEGARVADPAAFAETVKTRIPSCHVALVVDGPPARGKALPRGVDHFVVRPADARAFAPLLAEALDTRRRLRALEAFSLLSKKREIIGEISTVSTHLAGIHKLKERNREFEERLEELEAGKDRLAAEIRARDAELRRAEERIAALEAERDEARREVDRQVAALRARADETREGVDALREIRDRIARTLAAAASPPAAGGDAPPTAAEPGRRVAELEARLAAADRVFERILAALAGFVGADRPDLDALFDEITSALAEFTSL